MTEQAERNNEPTNAEEAAAQRKADANLSLEEKYQAHVATLTPEQQAWEVVLQENLGGFYLPIHQKEKIAGKSNAWDFVQDVPGLPRVLVIGDSISRGYTAPLRHKLKGKVNLHRAPENCGPTARGIKHLDLWLGDGDWDLITLNFGIHDRHTSIDDYRMRLNQIITRLNQTGAQVVWVTTTPVPPGALEYVEGSVERLNQAAQAIMQEQNIPVLDLNQAITPVIPQYQLPENCHFKESGYQFMGDFLAEKLMAKLQADAPEKE